MDIKKGIKLTAVGFLFTLVNFNLTFNGIKVNIMPDFIGWFLFCLALGYFGDYTRNRSFLKWGALILAIVEGAFWILEVVKPELTGQNLELVKSVINVFEAGYMFLLFDVLERIAGDLGSRHADTIRMLKYINFALYLFLAAMGLMYGRIDESVLAMIILLAGSMALVAAIFSAATLFRLNKEMKEM